MNIISQKVISIETLVILLIFSFLIIAPTTTDDGWNFFIMDNYLRSGDLFLFGFDVQVNFSRVTYILQASLLNLFGFTLAQFIYISVFSLIGFYAISNMVKTRFVGGEKLLYYTLYVLFYFSTFYILKTRPEAVYVNLLFIVIYLLTTNLNKRLSFLNLFLISVSLAFATASHPNGSFGFVIFLIYYFGAKENRPKFYSLSLFFISFVLFTFLFTFINISVKDFFISLDKLSSDSGHRVPIYKEYLRYLYFYSNSKILFSLFLPVTLIIIKYRNFFVGHFTNLLKNNEHFRFSIKCLIAGLFFLILNPAKWDTYLVLILVFIIDLFVFLSSIISRKERYLFIIYNSLLIVFSWIHLSKNNEASVFNSVVNQEYLDSLSVQCNELVESRDMVFVQHGVYPLFRTFEGVNIFWQISEYENDMNIPDFENSKLDRVDFNNSRIAIVTAQRNLIKYYNVSICDSIRFNNNVYLIYKNI